VRFWFVQLETLFRTSKISDDQTMYDYVLQSLDLNVASDIADLIEEPPEEDRYETIKKTLIDRLGKSEDARIKAALSNEPLGDRTPSQHYRYLLSNAGQNFSAEALAIIWANALPHNVRAIVTSAADLAIEKRAEMADRIMDITGTRGGVAAIAASGSADPSSSLENQLSAITKQISSLSKTVQSLAKRDGQDGATKPKVRRDKSPAPRNGPAKDGLCWYHRRFKADATKCSPPCNWNPADNQGNGNARQ
jgi:hypothetical protein